MGSVFCLIKDVILPASGERIVKAAELETFFAAQDAITVAQARALEIKQRASEAYEQEKRKGYEQGLQESQMEYAEKIYALAIKSIESIESLESTIVNVVTEALERIIGEMDDNELIAKVVQNALNSVRSQQHVRVRVSPQDEKAVRGALASMLSAGPGGATFLDLVADPRLSPGACLLESELGVLDASLETQLKALERAFAAKIRANTPRDR